MHALRRQGARRAGRVGAIEALEDPRLLRLGDARPLVDHFDDDAVAGAARADLDDAAAGRVAHGVLEQVGDDLMDALRVAVGGELG